MSGFPFTFFQCAAGEAGIKQLDADLGGGEQEQRAHAPRGRLPHLLRSV